MNTISYNINCYEMTDKAIIKSLCNSLKQMRLQKNLSQDELAQRSGINRVTISRLETGKAINILTMIQILRALQKLELMSSLFEEPEISPILLMEAQQKYYRQKASPKK
jgi:transcriptional regulator with XRE-family HTH domain